MNVSKVGVLDPNDRINGQLPPEAVRLLCDLEPSEPVVVVLTDRVVMDYGARDMELKVLLPADLMSRQRNEPVSVTDPAVFTRHDADWIALIVFHNPLFFVRLPFLEPTSSEEALLQIKQLVLADDARLQRLRQETDALERIGTARGPRRQSLPDAIKLIVWARDEGRCVRCGSTANLQFDHIIPVSQGGGNTEHNLQILCEYCNLRKADRIAF